MFLTNTNKIKVFISFVIVALLITGCDVEQNLGGDESDDYTDGRVIGTIHGVVKDAYTNARLKDIVVTTTVKGEIHWVFTNDVGHYAITNLSPGEYELTFSGSDGYAIMSTQETIPTLSQIGVTDMATNADFHYTETTNMVLFPLSAGLTGTVYTEQDDENTTLAGAGVTVIANFESALSPSWYSAVTDSNSVYSFSNLPAAETDIITLPFSDGTYDYDIAFSEVEELLPGLTVTNDPIILQIATAEPFVLTNNFENDDFGLTESLTMAFSKTMDASSFDITLSSEYGNVEFESSWTNDITLTIDPLVTLQANTTYSLSLNGNSQDNNNYSDNLNFKTIDGIEFVSTNLERVDGVFDEFSVSSNIELLFTMEANLNNYNGYVTLIDESGSNVSTSLSTDSTTLAIDPLYNLEPGQNYNLNWRVYSIIEGDYDYGSIDFETASDETIPNQITGFAVDMGDGWTADWNTTSVSFKWNTGSNVDGYRIYAKDNGDNTDLVTVGTFGAQDYNTEVSGTVTLPSQFDYYDDDGIQTPFTAGTEVSFFVVAYNDVGEGPFSDALVVKDETAPTISISQNGSADNTTGENAEFVVDLDNQIEYCSTTNNPTFNFVENGGDPGHVLPSSAIAWDWDSDLRDGQANVTVPDGKNGAGDMLITTFTDNSGNTSDPDTLYLTPIISFVSPTADTTWETPGANINWSINNTGVSPGISSVDVWLSIDGGASWIDTLTEGTSSTNYSWTIPDTLISNAQAVIGITDAESGGYTWKSSLFTISGIRVTAPTSGAGEAGPAYQDSVAIEINWDHAGIDSVLIEYSDFSGNWTVVDTTNNTGTYDWTPQLGLSDESNYKIRVSDFDADYRPRDESDWFTIIPN